MLRDIIREISQLSQNHANADPAPRTPVLAKHPLVNEEHQETDLVVGTNEAGLIPQLSPIQAAWSTGRSWPNVASCNQHDRRALR
jgi:hypothetical protein